MGELKIDRVKYLSPATISGEISFAPTALNTTINIMYNLKRKTPFTLFTLW